jgi:DNA-binding beta-propeller fold protein YncE
MRIEDRLRSTFSTRAGSARPSEDAWEAIEADLARRQRRRAVAGFLAAGSAVALLVVSTGWLWSALRETPGPGSENEAPLNPRVAATIRVGASPAGLSVGEDAVWVAVPKDPCAGEVVRIDLATNGVAARIPIEGYPSDLTVGWGSVWVEGSVCGPLGRLTGAVTRIDATSGRVLSTIEVGDSTADVAAGEGAVWVTVPSRDGSSVVRIDPQTDTVVARIPVEGDPRDVLAGEGGVWLFGVAPEEQPGLSGMQVTHIDPVENQVVATIPDAVSLGVGEGFVWVGVWLDRYEGGLLRLDPGTDRPVGEAIEGAFAGFAGEHDTIGTLAVGGGGVWYWSSGGERARIFRLNAATLELDASAATGEIWIDAAVAPDGETLWISNYEDTVTRIDLR